MDRTIHKIFPGNETIIPGRFPIFPGSDAIILGQFPLKIASKSTKIEKIEQKIKFFAPAWGLVETFPHADFSRMSNVHLWDYLHCDHVL